MNKPKALFKALLFGIIMLAFLVVASLIAKALKLSPARTYVFKGAFMLISAIVPLLYSAGKNYTYSDIGFNKPTKKNLKVLLFYIPFILCLIPLFLDFNKTTSTKTLIVALFYYGCLALSAEIYFRGLIQKELRGNVNIYIMVIFTAILFALCNIYYLFKITYYKHILVLSVGSFALAGITCITVENKGNIVFTGIFNALFFFIASSFIKSGARLILAVGISCALMFVYGIYQLIMYLKGAKKEEPNNDYKEDFGNNENIELE